MNVGDIELTRQRRRLEDLESGVVDGGTGASQGASTVLVKTSTKGSYPMDPDRYFYCQCCRIGGPEVEGGDGTVDPIGGAFLYAYNIGSRVPPSGTVLHATFVAGRWIIRYDG